MQKAIFLTQLSIILLSNSLLRAQAVSLASGSDPDYREVNSVFATGISNDKHIVFDGITGKGQWYSCDKTKAQLFEKDKQLIAYINQSKLECFGIYFDPINLKAFDNLNFTAAIETKLNFDSITVFVAFIDSKKTMTDLKALSVPVSKGPFAHFSIPLKDVMRADPKTNFFAINSILFYVSTQKEGGFWGNVLLKDIGLVR